MVLLGQNPDPSRLAPRPKIATQGEEAFPLPASPAIAQAFDRREHEPAIERLAAVLSASGRPPQYVGLDLSHIRLLRDSGLDLPAQGYELAITDKAIVIRAAEASGMFYGVCTLIQWLRMHIGFDSETRSITTPIRGLFVRDWPDFAQRGVMLDISRCKVPRMDELLRQIDRLASWKINQIQLYTEHTFAYSGHQTVWHEADPMTPAQIRELDEFCRKRCMDLVPNQNSFGHMHRWLTHPAYRPLAECPDGVDHPFSPRREPFSLCPGDPGSLSLLGDLYDQLLPNFSSGLFNVGLDETFDLGLGRSAQVCQDKGKEQVYLDFLVRVNEAAAARGKRMMFWGDIIIRRPDLLDQLPREAIALEWGYEAGHPFPEHARQFAASGRSFYVCPGTSAWTSIAGRFPNAIANLAEAARAGFRNGALGYLITDWGDYGHLQPLTSSFPGLLAGACFAWNVPQAEEPSSVDWDHLMDEHAFEDQAGQAGAICRRLGEAYLHCGALPTNGSALFFILLYAAETMAHPRLAGLELAALERTQAFIEEAIAPLQRTRIARDDKAQIGAELGWVADMLRFACRLGKFRLTAGPDRHLQDLAGGPRQELAVELAELIERRRSLWLVRNRPGGLNEAMGYLQRIHDLLRA